MVNVLLDPSVNLITDVLMSHVKFGKFGDTILNCRKLAADREKNDKTGNKKRCRQFNWGKEPIHTCMKCCDFVFVDLRCVFILEELVLEYSNYAWQDVVTPIKVTRLRDLLIEMDYDSEKSKILVDGFLNGFDIGYRRPLMRRHKSRKYSNYSWITSIVME